MGNVHTDGHEVGNVVSTRANGLHLTPSNKAQHSDGCAQDKSNCENVNYYMTVRWYPSTSVALLQESLIERA